MGDATDVDRIPILFEPMWLTHRKPEMATSLKLSDPDAKHLNKLFARPSEGAVHWDP